METEYDVVVVGAGSAGAPVAAHAGRRCRVLLLEAGPDYRAGETPAEIRGPNFAMALGSGRHHWTDLQVQVTPWQEPHPYLAGRGVGGSSAINSQGAVRPPPGDFDRWVAAGCEGWSFEDVLPAFVAVERDLDYGDRPYHGSSGPLPVSRVDEAQWGAVSRALLEAAAGAGHPFSPDRNAPDSRGLSPATWSRDAGGRVTTNDAFIEPARELPGLHVAGGALVERVEFEGTRVAGVRYRTDGGPATVRTRRVVLSAGALSSPALLLRSGVGPADELRRLGVDVVADVPGVGANLQEHPLAWLTMPLRPEARAPSPLVLPGHCALRLATGESGAEDCEVIPLDRSPGAVEAGGLMVALLDPEARGRVRLPPIGVAGPPVVELGLLSRDRDLRRLRAALRQVAELAAHHALAGVAEDGIRLDGTPLPEASDAELDAWLRASAVPYFHASGTCRMGPPGDPGAVVDLTGRVRGVEGLWVIDASTLPVLPTAPIHLTTVVLAERLAPHVAA